MRERAVALVFETQSDYGSQWEAIVSVAESLLDRLINTSHQVFERTKLPTQQAPTKCRQRH